MAEVVLSEVNKVYGDGTHAVRDLSLRADDGRVLVLVGPSGCGKTTALRMVAGLEEITAGVLHIGERVVNDLDPRARDIAMVFQDYALYPHMTVENNIGFPLRLHGMSRRQREEKVRAVARLLGLEAHLGRKPPQLSGGQRQRVAMGRAIVREPSVFLMDEPLSNLDAKLRVQMRAEISALQREIAVTTIYVTHDQVEAMTIGDKVAVMRRSELQQVADPQTLYDRPANVFVAGFVGSPPMNFIEADLTGGSDGTLEVAIGATRVRVDEAERSTHRGLGAHTGGRVIVGVRPERLVEFDRVPDDRRISGQVTLAEALGSDSLVHVVLADVPGPSRALIELAHDREEAVEQEDLRVEDRTSAIARFDPRTAVRPLETIQLGLERDALHFFDPADGVRIA